MTDELFADRYRLERRLGAGGMSTVELAFDTRLERYVAVKLLAEHLAQDSNFVARFRREALSAARLVHPNCVQVFDFGLDDATERQFIVMEHVDGQSCAEILRDEGHLGVEPAVDVLTQACRGLDYAHRNGVVHRDVKPGNLLRSNDGVVKLADFGIAKAAEQSDITKVGSVVGTAAYLSPEQARGEDTGPLADLYSLGVVAYQIISGRLPYQATSLSELALKQQNEPPPRLDELEPEVPEGLATAVANALALQPAARPQGALALAEVLEAGRRGDEVEDATASTVALADSTATTGLISREDLDATQRVPTARERGETAPERGDSSPRQLQARRGAAAPPPERAADRRPAREPARTPARRRGLRRLGALLLLLLVVLIGGIVITPQSAPPDGVKLRRSPGTPSSRSTTTCTASSTTTRSSRA